MATASSGELPTLSNGLLADEDEPAIMIRNAYRHHGHGSKKVDVLMGLDMTIPKGTIYGLLGPSGCGKTTLLQCIVGKQTPQSGDVLVFGGEPGTARSGVPGKRVGYMPQELALYREFTVFETFSYFGRIFNMSKENVEERSNFLIDFLDLPSDRKRLIMNLSGGQQRRASLAAALLHEPELLILDEPTVGVDPLLRHCIWNHLTAIADSGKTRKTTIVVTTHYIEEARQAHIVGMMRSGKLLAEDSPSVLMRRFERANLEDVFLNLCLGKEEEESNRPKENGKNCSLKNEEEMKSLTDLKETNLRDDSYATRVKKNRRSWKERICSNFERSFVESHRLNALLMKNFIRMWRNIGFLMFQFILPTIQVSLFCLAIGRDLKGMTLAVVNDEIPGPGCLAFTDGCILGAKDDFFKDFVFSDIHLRNLSCRYLDYVDESIIKPVFFDDLEAAEASVRSGKHWGVMLFKQNFSMALYDRMFGVSQLKIPDNRTLDRSNVHVYLDMTNQQVAYTIRLRLTEAYQRFTGDLMEACGIPGELVGLPIDFADPLYGSPEPMFTEFMAPGVILSITYFMAVGLTALGFIVERKEGLLDRSWIAGVTATEVTLAHVISQFAVMIVQVGLVLLFMIYVFALPAKGSMFWIVLLTVLQGICGMSFGLLVSAICDNEQDAIQVALGSFYPNLLLTGIVWPLEGMPAELKKFSYFLPQTHACEAMRGILSRGWGMEWEQVYTGYLVTITWTLALLVLSAIILRIRQ